MHRETPCGGRCPPHRRTREGNCVDPLCRGDASSLPRPLLATPPRQGIQLPPKQRPRPLASTSTRTPCSAQCAPEWTSDPPLNRPSMWGWSHKPNGRPPGDDLASAFLGASEADIRGMSPFSGLKSRARVAQARGLKARIWTLESVAAAPNLGGDADLGRRGVTSE